MDSESENKPKSDAPAPTLITGSWLWENVPAKFWIWLGGVFFAIFSFGLATGQLPTIKKAVEDVLLGCREKPKPENRPFEILQYDDVKWATLIGNAKSRIEANGIVLTHVEPGQIVTMVTNNKNFKATLVLMKPQGKAIGAWARDEEMTRNPAKITQKLLAFRELGASKLSQEEQTRLSVGCVDIYPTIAVTIIDEDLYAYFRPHGIEGTSSPVLKFTDYRKMPQSESGMAAAFFERHLQALEEEAKRTDYEKCIKE